MPSGVPPVAGEANCVGPGGYVCVATVPGGCAALPALSQLPAGCAGAACHRGEQHHHRGGQRGQPLSQALFSVGGATCLPVPYAAGRLGLFLVPHLAAVPKPDNVSVRPLLLPTLHTAGPGSQQPAGDVLGGDATATLHRPGSPGPATLLRSKRSCVS